MRLIHHIFILLTAAAWTAAPVAAFGQGARGLASADEYPPKHAGSQSGVPLSHYCTHVPDLTVTRPDSVDTWIKICTVYFNAKIAPPGPPPNGQSGDKQQQPAFKQQLPPPR